MEEKDLLWKFRYYLTREKKVRIVWNSAGPQHLLTFGFFSPVLRR
jgi:hypothetical protein